MSGPTPSPSPQASSPSAMPSPSAEPSPSAKPSPQAEYPPIPPLPEIPSNAYQLLLNLSSSIDTTTGSFNTAAGKLGSIHDLSNTAVGDVVSTSKGEATNGLSDIWGYTKQDFTNAHTPLTSITASHALGGSPNPLQEVLTQHKSNFLNGVPAVEHLRQMMASGFASNPSPQQVQDLVNLSNGLISALGDVNMALQLMIIAISNINGGISYSCATGLVPGQPLPMFNTHTFAMEGKNGGGGSQNLTADQLAQQIEDQGVDEETATYIALYAEEQGLNLSDIQNMLDTMVNGGGDAELSAQQMQQWVENGTISNWLYDGNAGRSLSDVTSLLKQGVDSDSMTQLLNHKANLNQISSDLPLLIKQAGTDPADPSQLASWMQSLDADQLTALKNRIAQNPKISLSDLQHLTDPTLKYDPNPKHANAIPDFIGPEPNNGQAALNNSVSIGPNTNRRIGIDTTSDEIVVIDDTNDGMYHGHVRTWNQLTQEMKTVLLQDGFISKTGRIILRDAQGNIIGNGPKVGKP
jgi:hypothetical protein